MASNAIFFLHNLIVQKFLLRFKIFSNFLQKMKIYYKNDIFLQICKGDRGVQKTWSSSSTSYLFFLSIFFFFNTIPETPLGLRPRFARNNSIVQKISLRVEIFFKKWNFFKLFFKFAREMGGYKKRGRRGTFFFYPFSSFSTQFPRLRSAFGLASLGINAFFFSFYPIFTLIPYFCRTFVVLSENHKFEVGQLHQTSLKSLKT